MSDHDTETSEAPNEGMSERDAMIVGQSAGGGRGQKIAGAALLTAVGVAAWFILVPAGSDTTGPDTSQPADIQTPEQWSGVDTGMLVARDKASPGVEAAPVVMQLPPASTEGAGGSEADRARIADLERQINALRASQGAGPDFDASLQALRAEMDAQRARELALAEENYQLRLAEMTRDLSIGETGMSDEERDARARLEEERQRRAAIAEAQIMSDGIVIDSSSARAGGGSQPGAGAGDGSSGRTLSSNGAFMEQASTRSYETVQATQIAAPDRTIVQGTTLNAVLETAISTELPGVIRAVVTDDVMSFDGTNVLLPQGTRLIGSYNPDVSVMQDRVQMAWNRAVTPEGVSVELSGYGADALGRSGQSGFTDTRFRQRFGSAALISLISAGPELVVDRDTSGATSDTVQDVGDDLSTATRGVMGDYLSAGPVIYIDQGTYMTVFVNRDLVL